jgi:ComF family protein
MTDDMAEPQARAKRHIRGGLSRALDVLWPREPVVVPGAPPLHILTAPLCHTCSVPLGTQALAQFGSGGQPVCASCLATPRPWQAARAVFAYDDASRGMILALKHAAQRDRLAQMGRWLAWAGRDRLECADILVPVPLHWRRLMARGFNQSLWLAASVSRETGVPLAHHTLRRVRATPSQAGLSPAARARNVAGAFRVVPKRAFAGRRVVLVDDVFTTGATLSACTHALDRAGATSVDVLVLARVVRATDDLI